MVGAPVGGHHDHLVGEGGAGADESGGADGVLALLDDGCSVGARGCLEDEHAALLGVEDAWGDSCGGALCVGGVAGHQQLEDGLADGGFSLSEAGSGARGLLDGALGGQEVENAGDDGVGLRGEGGGGQGEDGGGAEVADREQPDLPVPGVECR